MNNKDRTKDWRELCKAAATETDPNKFMDLIAQINNTLDELDRKQKFNARNESNCRASSLPPGHLIA
jgi:hypothetical protein